MFHTTPNVSIWSRAAWLNGTQGMIRHEFEAGDVVEEAYIFSSTLGFQASLIPDSLPFLKSQFAGASTERCSSGEQDQA